MWILSGILRIMVFVFGLVALAFAVVFFLTIGLIMALMGKKPRIVRMSSVNWRDIPSDDFRPAPKDVTPKAFPALDQ